MREVTCLSVDVPEHLVSDASTLLWSHGANAVVEVPLEGGIFRLVAGFPSGGTEKAAAALRDFPVRIFRAAYEGWLEAWKPFARPLRVGSFAVVPSWEEIPSWAKDLTVLSIDAGASFGQGSHPTTRLALRAIDHLAAEGTLAGRDFLDAGCGSGILSIAAALSGARRVLAVDIDQAAVEATESNAARNGVSERVSTVRRDISELQGEFFVVAANLLAHMLVDTAAHLSGLTAHGGYLVLSGLRTSQVPKVAAAFAPTTVVRTFSEEGWSALLLAKPPELVS